MKLKNDRFRKNRGGYSRLLSLKCEKCSKEVLKYQKDGPGILKRLYLDRIIPLRKMPSNKNLVCQKCKTLIGIPIIYKKEKRPAYRLFAGAITKNIIKKTTNNERIKFP